MVRLLYANVGSLVPQTSHLLYINETNIEWNIYLISNLEHIYFIKQLFLRFLKYVLSFIFSHSFGTYVLCKINITSIYFYSIYLLYVNLSLAYYNNVLYRGLFETLYILSFSR